MGVTTSADLTAKQISYAPKIDTSPKTIPIQIPEGLNPASGNLEQGSSDPIIPNVNIVQGETTPTIPNPNIVQGETSPVLSNPNIVQGETTPASYNFDPVQSEYETQDGSAPVEGTAIGTNISNIPLDPITKQGSTTVVAPELIIEQGKTAPIIPNPNIEQGSSTPIIPNPVINQGSIDLILPNINIEQGSTTPTIPNPNIIQGQSTPIIPNPNINQGSIDIILPNVNIQQGSTTPIASNPNIVQGQTTPVIPNPTINQGSTDVIVPNVNIEQGSTTPVLSNPNIIQGETTPIPSNPNIIQGETTPVIPNPNIIQGETTPILSNPNIQQGQTTPIPSNPNIVQGETTPVLSNPNIVQGETTPIPSNPNIIQGETTPIPSNPNIIQGETTPIPSNPNIIQGETTPTIPNPNIVQGETTPTIPNPNIVQGSTTPTIPNPNIVQGETTPIPSNPNIIQGETTPIPSNPNIVQGETTPTIPNPNIVQGETTPVPSNPNIVQGETTPVPSNPNIVQGETTPTIPNPNIVQGETTPVPSNPNIVQGETTPVPSNPTINQGSTPPLPQPNPRPAQGGTTVGGWDPDINQGAGTLRLGRAVGSNQASALQLTSTGNQGSSNINSFSWQNPNGGTVPSERYATNVLVLSTQSNTSVSNSLRFGSNQSVPLFTLPIISGRVGGVSISGLATAGLLAAGAPEAAQAVSAANYLANLPLTLYSRPEGALLIGIQVASIAFSHFMTRRNMILDGMWPDTGMPPVRDQQIKHGLSNIMAYAGIRSVQATTLSPRQNEVSFLLTPGNEVWKKDEPIFIDRLPINIGPIQKTNNSIDLSKRPFGPGTDTLHPSAVNQSATDTIMRYRSDNRALGDENVSKLEVTDPGSDSRYEQYPVPYQSDENVITIPGGMIPSNATTYVKLSDAAILDYNRISFYAAQSVPGSPIVFINQSNKQGLPANNNLDNANLIPPYELGELKSDKGGILSPADSLDGTGNGTDINKLSDAAVLDYDRIAFYADESTPGAAIVNVKQLNKKGLPANNNLDNANLIPPYELGGLMTDKGGIITPGDSLDGSGNITDIKSLHKSAFNNLSSGHSVLTYDAIAARAAQTQTNKGTILSDFRSEITDAGVSTQTSDTKQVLTTFNWRRPSEILNTNPTTDFDIVDDLNGSVYQDIPVDDLGSNDFVRLAFRKLGDSRFLQFRSYISNFSDTFNSNWTDITYIGRPNPLKLFNNVSRDVSLDFIVPALSRGELKTMYQKLQELAKFTMPENVGLMVAPVLELYLGDWFSGEKCHITSLGYGIETEYPWEINIENSEDVGELPHIIKVTMGIYIIGNRSMTSTDYAVFGKPVNS